MSKPIAVVISDIHFTVATLDLATAALTQALDKAVDLDVPLVIAGDTLDTKAIMRAECVNRLLEIAETTPWDTKVYILVGNHDLLNEKGSAHSLAFLSQHWDVISSPVDFGWITFLPYQSDKSIVQRVVDATSNVIIMHQGVMGAKMGHYAVDNSSLLLETFKGRTVISGHYHQAQTLEITGGGSYTYIGNPYTLNFGEANDPPKGFIVLNDDGTIERIPTNLRRHVVIDIDLNSTDTLVPPVQSNDLCWVKLRGTKTQLATWDKDRIAKGLGLPPNFKLDLIPEGEAEVVHDIDNYTSSELLDTIIDTAEKDPENKVFLKKLWREVLGETT